MEIPKETPPAEQHAGQVAPPDLAALLEKFSADISAKFEAVNEEIKSLKTQHAAAAQVPGPVGTPEPQRQKPETHDAPKVDIHAMTTDAFADILCGAL